MVAKYYNVVSLFVIISTSFKLFIHRQYVVRSSINLLHLQKLRLVINCLNLILEILVNFRRMNWLHVTRKTTKCNVPLNAFPRTKFQNNAAISLTK